MKIVNLSLKQLFTIISLQFFLALLLFNSCAEDQEEFTVDNGISLGEIAEKLKGNPTFENYLADRMGLYIMDSVLDSSLFSNNVLRKLAPKVSDEINGSTNSLKELFDTEFGITDTDSINTSLYYIVSNDPNICQEIAKKSGVSFGEVDESGELIKPYDCNDLELSLDVDISEGISKLREAGFYEQTPADDVDVDRSSKLSARGIGDILTLFDSIGFLGYVAVTGIASVLNLIGIPAELVNDIRIVLDFSVSLIYNLLYTFLKLLFIDSLPDPYEEDCTECPFTEERRLRTGDLNVYYGHVHNHTTLTDGMGKVENAFPYAREVSKLDFMGISPHGTQLTPYKWNLLKQIANDNNRPGEFAAFMGFEWSSEIFGHVNVLGTCDYTNIFLTPHFLSLVDFVEKRNGIAFFNHPGRENTFNREFELFEEGISDRFVGMELWNRANGFERYYYNDGYNTGDNGRGYFDEALSKGWKIGASGSHDHHGLSWGETDMTMAVLSEELSRESIMCAIRKKRFYSTEDRSIKLYFYANDHYPMGSEVDAGDLTLNLTTWDDEPEDDNQGFSKIQLYHNGILTEEVFPTEKESVSLSWKIVASSRDYYYVKVTQDDTDEAISSPIFVK